MSEKNNWLMCEMRNLSSKQIEDLHNFANTLTNGSDIYKIWKKFNYCNLDSIYNVFKYSRKKSIEIISTVYNDLRIYKNSSIIKVIEAAYAIGDHKYIKTITSPNAHSIKVSNAGKFIKIVSLDEYYKCRCRILNKFNILGIHLKYAENMGLLGVTIGECKTCYREIETEITLLDDQRNGKKVGETFYVGNVAYIHKKLWKTSIDYRKILVNNISLPISDTDTEYISPDTDKTITQKDNDSDSTIVRKSFSYE